MPCTRQARILRLGILFAMLVVGFCRVVWVVVRFCWHPLPAILSAVKATLACCSRAASFALFRPVSFLSCFGYHCRRYEDCRCGGASARVGDRSAAASPRTNGIPGEHR